MAEVLHENLEKIEASDVHQKLGLKREIYASFGAPGENIDTEKNFLSLFNTTMPLQKNMICQSFIPAIQAKKG